MTATRTAPAKAERIEVNGRPIRARLFQVALWTPVLGALGAAGFLAHYYVGTGHHVPFLAP